jgi:hypothetical protein
MPWGERYCRTDSAARCERASLIIYTLTDYVGLHIQPVGAAPVFPRSVFGRSGTREKFLLCIAFEARSRVADRDSILHELSSNSIPPGRLPLPPLGHAMMTIIRRVRPVLVFRRVIIFLSVERARLVP